MKYTFTAREVRLDVGGLTFLCIYGRHLNGGFVAFTEWGVSAELSSGLDYRYNADKLLNALERSYYSCYLPFYEEYRYEIVHDLAVLITDRIAEL